MYLQDDKSKANKSRAIAYSVAQKADVAEQDLGFVDSRPVSIAQRRLQSICNRKGEVVQRANEKIAAAAEELEGNFIWTLPEGTLEYSTIIEHWNDYRNELLDGVSLEFKEKVMRINMGIHNLLIIKPEGYLITIKNLLDEISVLISSSNRIDGMISLTDDFSVWLSTGLAPTHLNCWEAVIFTCEKAGIISRDLMLEYCSKRAIENQMKTDSSALFRKFILGRSVEDLIEADWEEDLPEHEDPINAQRGDILCFWQDKDIHHVAIYTGENECMSIWAEDTLHFSKTAVTGLLKKYSEPHVEIIRK